jgi:hypothetical protein
MLHLLSKRLFSTTPPTTAQGTATKLSHVRLNFKDFAQKLPLIKQNVLNRKATSYANADLVNHLYEEYRRMKFDLD